MDRKLMLQLESLEDRCVPATFNVPWSDPRHLTLSFVPDGTDVGGVPSSLFSTLNTLTRQSSWQTDILRAVQTWAVVGNVNVGLVTDNGDPMGIAGLAQNDPRFGTIRIGAKPLADNVLAIGIPPDPYFSGTWAGDIIFNTNANLSAQNTDLYSVFLHEVGHALGLPDSNDVASSMYETASGHRSGISSGDISALTALYGSRPSDSNESNDGISSATKLQGGTGATPIIAYGDITTPKDVDYFQYQAISGYSGTTSFRVQATGISLLGAKVSLVDNKNRDVVASVSSSLAGDTITLTIPQTTPGVSYYLRIESGTNSSFRVGRYGVAITLDSRVTISASEIDAVLRGPFDTLSPSDLTKVFTENGSAIFSNDAHSDDDFADATILRPAAGLLTGSTYNAVGSLSDSTDVDIYRVRSPRPTGASTVSMTVNITPMIINGVIPRVQLYGRDLKPVSSTILANGDGIYVLQATGLQTNIDYFVRLENPASANLGNYSLNVQFGTQTAAIENFVEGMVPATGSSSTVYVAKPQLFHLLLSSIGGGMMVNIVGANTSFTLTTSDGGVVSSSILLQPGEYRVSFVPTNPLSNSTFASLRGAILSDPIGSVVIDPNQAPLYPTPGNPGTNTYPNGTVTTKPYLWLSLTL